MNYLGNVVCIALVVCAELVSTSSAALLSTVAGSGHTSGASAAVGGVDGTVNYAVYKRDGLICGDVYGIGHSGVDTTLQMRGFDVSADYLYLYQTVNNGSTNEIIASTSIGLNQSAIPHITGFGALPFVLTDADCLIGAANNLGKDSLPFAPPGEIAPADAPGGQPISFGSDPTAKGVAMLGSVPLMFITPAHSLVIFHSGGLLSGQTSTVFGFSTDRAPVLSRVTVVDSGTSFEGTVSAPANTPVSAPAPATPLALVSLALVAFLRNRKRFRRLLIKSVE